MLLHLTWELNQALDILQRKTSVGPKRSQVALTQSNPKHKRYRFWWLCSSPFDSRDLSLRKKTESTGFDGGRSNWFFLSATKLQSATSPSKRVKVKTLRFLWSVYLKVSPTITSCLSRLNRLIMKKHFSCVEALAPWGPRGLRFFHKTTYLWLKCHSRDFCVQEYGSISILSRLEESHNRTPSTEGWQTSRTTRATSTRQPQVTRPHKQLAHILWSSKLIIDHIIAVALMRDHTFSSSLGLSKRWIHIKTVCIFLFMPRNTFGRARLGRNKLRCQERSKARKGTWQKAPLHQKTWRIWHQMASNGIQSWKTLHSDFQTQPRASWANTYTTQSKDQSRWCILLAAATS